MTAPTVDVEGVIAEAEEWGPVPFSIMNLLRQQAEQIDRAYKVLEMYGVPRERAKSVSNGIMVLVTRMDKQIAELTKERDEHAKAAGSACLALAKQDDQIAELRKDAERCRLMLAELGVLMPAIASQGEK